MKQTNGFGQEQEIIEKDEFFISHIPQEGGMGVECVEGETAIVANGEYFILNGNHLKAYSKCKGLKECMKYFDKNSEIKSSWSN